MKKTLTFRALLTAAILVGVLISAGAVPSTAAQAAGKSYITSSVLAKDVVFQDGVWVSKDETNVFGPDCSKVYWVGSAKTGLFGKADSVAEWYAPDGSVYDQEEFKFDSNGTAYVTLCIGGNSWERVQPGEWKLVISRKGYESTEVPFTVEPAKDPEKLAPLYQALQPKYAALKQDELPSLRQENVVASETGLAEFKGGVYVHVSGMYVYGYSAQKTTRAYRAGDVVQGPIMRTFKSMHKTFAGPQGVKGYMVDLLYLVMGTSGSDDYEIETTKMIVPAAEMEKYVQMEITLQELVNSSIVLVNDERIQPTF